MGSKTVYQLDSAGYFVGTATADESPREPGVFLMPGGCIDKQPPVNKPGTRRQFVGGKWSYEQLPGYGAPAAKTAEPTVDDIKAAKTAEINAWRAIAESLFEYGGKLFGCDTASRTRLDGVANCIALTGAFPDGYAGAWKATDNALVPLETVKAFKAFYAAMSAAGAAAFNRAQDLKARVAAAKTADEVAAIAWRDAPAPLPE